MKIIQLLIFFLIHQIVFSQAFNISKKSRILSTLGFNGNGSIAVSSAMQTANPRNRTFSYHLPTASPDCNRPLLIVLHGDGGSGAGIQGYAGFDGIADTANFLVAYPNAANTLWGIQFNKYADNVAGFAGIPDPNAADDVQYISDLIDYFFNTYGIDKSRVYITGHSGGAFMAYFLALADGTKNKVAAIAPVAASVWGESAYINAQSTVANYSPIAIMHLHCTADATVSFPVVGATYTWPLSIFSQPACGNPAPVTTVINPEVDKLTYCSSGKKIELIKLKRVSLGHGWPILANSGYDAPAEIWNFIKNYSKGTYPSSLANPSVNPASATVSIGQSVSLTASGCPSGTTYVWKEGTTTVGTTASFTMPNVSMSTSYTAYCVNATCQSSGLAVPITVHGPVQPILDNHIKIDQFGYRPSDKKIAVISRAFVGYNSPDAFVPSTASNQYQIRKVSDNTVVFTGTAIPWNSGAVDASSGDAAWWFDFSNFNLAGDYYVYDLGLNRKSYNFSIADNVYAAVSKQAVKALYYQRCGVAKTLSHGGIWNDTACHLHAEQDTDCRSAENPVPSTSKDLSGGWHDAGDYNKYVLLAHPAVDGLLHAYEEKPTFWGDDSNIPESGNNIPDILDELKIELDWLLKMQLTDGSVLSKVSVMTYSEGSPASSSTVARRYAPANTVAALSFSAMLAHAALVYRAFPAFSAYANTLKNAAINAYDWALANPNVTFSNAGYASAAVNGSVYDRTYALKISAAIYLFNLTQNSTYKTFIDANYTNINMMNFVYEYEGNTQDAMLYYANLPFSTPTVSAAIKNAYTIGIKLGSNNLPTYTNVNQDPYRAYTNFYSFNNNHFKAFKGLMYQNAIKYNLDPANNQIYADASLTFLNYLHGVNPNAKAYLSNMSAFNAENSVNEIYHTWFGDGTIYDGTVSPKIGAPPGFLVCGADQAYLTDGGSAAYNPPANQPPQKSYLDFNTSAAASWVNSEIAIYNQATYTRLLQKFVKQNTAVSNVTYCLPVSSASNLSLVGFTLNGQVLSQNSGYAENGYALFANAAPLLSPNLACNFSTFKNVTGSHVESIWLDLNRDGDFDDLGELLSQVNVNTITNTGSFTIPSSISSGYTRLRVRLSNTVSNACTNDTGETEDYVVELQACGTVNNPVAVVNPAIIKPGDATGLSANGCDAGGTYVWKNGTSTLASTSVYYTPPVFVNTSYTVYCVLNDCLSSGVSVSLTVNAALPCSETKLVNGVATILPLAVNKVDQASKYVIMGNTVHPMSITNLNSNNYIVKAGNSIELNPGLSVGNGVIFKAEIGGCEN
jgi:poly(3-hydroxybutyrate) depolymerase